MLAATQSIYNFAFDSNETSASVTAAFARAIEFLSFTVTAVAKFRGGITFGRSRHTE